MMLASGPRYRLGHFEEDEVVVVVVEWEDTVNEHGKRIPIRRSRGTADFKEAPPSLGRTQV
jgi:hypothetical protein